MRRNVFPPESLEYETTTGISMHGGAYYSYSHIDGPLMVQHWSNLSFLKFEDFNLAEIPQEISLLKRMRELDFLKNKLKNIPDTIKDLKELEVLKLEKNEFSTFPQVITECKKLKVLDLKDNLLTEIPNEIENLTNLRHLNLSKNQLTFLPSSFVNMRSLILLDLRDNPIQEQGSNGNLGKLELRTLYGDRVVFQKKEKQILK